LVARYIADCAEAARFPTIEALARERRPVVLWGAGSFARRLLATTPLARCALSAVIDSDPAKQGEYLAGHRILGPAAARSLDAPILVCAAVGVQSIVAQIRALGIENPIMLPDGTPACA
jgi:hypothetical protein